jgi:hypothetical protein
LVQAVTMQSLLANNIMYNGNPSKPVAPNGAKAKVLSAFWATASEWHCSHCSCSLHCRWSVCRVVRSRRCAVQRESPRSAPPVAAQVCFITAVTAAAAVAAAPCSMQLGLQIGAALRKGGAYPGRAASDDQLQRRLRRRLGDRQQSRAQLVPRELRCTLR